MKIKPLDPRIVVEYVDGCYCLSLDLPPDVYITSAVVSDDNTTITYTYSDGRPPLVVPMDTYLDDTDTVAQPGTYLPDPTGLICIPTIDQDAAPTGDQVKIQLPIAKCSEMVTGQTPAADPNNPTAAEAAAWYGNATGANPDIVGVTDTNGRQYLVFPDGSVICVPSKSKVTILTDKQVADANGDVDAAATSVLNSMNNGDIVKYTQKSNGVMCQDWEYEKVNGVVCRRLVNFARHQGNVMHWNGGSSVQYHDIEATDAAAAANPNKLSNASETLFQVENFREMVNPDPCHVAMGTVYLGGLTAMSAYISQPTGSHPFGQVAQARARIVDVAGSTTWTSRWYVYSRGYWVSTETADTSTGPGDIIPYDFTPGTGVEEASIVSGDHVENSIPFYGVPVDGRVEVDTRMNIANPDNASAFIYKIEYTPSDVDIIMHGIGNPVV